MLQPCVRSLGGRTALVLIASPERQQHMFFVEYSVHFQEVLDPWIRLVQYDIVHWDSLSFGHDDPLE